MQWIDIQQNTPEWEELRVGRVGGSSIAKVMANYGKAFGKPAQELAERIALEQLQGKAVGSNYTNEHMQRGHAEEPIARDLYEKETFSEVTNGGYYIESEDVGVSPDGLVDNDGMIEIKCVIYSVHFQTKRREAYDPKYKWQLALNLSASGREWIDYVEFCSEFPKGNRLFVQRLTRADIGQMADKIRHRLSQFKVLVEQNKKIAIGQA